MHTIAFLYILVNLVNHNTFKKKKENFKKEKWSCFKKMKSMLGQSLLHIFINFLKINFSVHVLLLNWLLYAYLNKNIYVYVYVFIYECNRPICFYGPVTVI